MGAARVLPSVDSPLADDASRQRELETLRGTLDALRNPAGAVRLAVQMLSGPLRAALDRAEPQDAAQIDEVLRALESATGELTRLLAPLRTAPPTADVLVMPAPAVGTEGLVAAVQQAVERRCPLPAHIDVRVEPGVCPVGDPRDLQTALVGLVENAIESMARRRPQASPWRVQLDVSLQPAEERGGAMHVVFEVRDRGDGIPPTVTDWLRDAAGVLPSPLDGGPGMSLQLARRVAEDAGGELRATRVGGMTRVQLRVPHG